MQLMMSYWTFSDVFEEQGIVKTPFYGGFGLIAERNIPKAAFRAFELLHQLGDQRIENNSENALVTKRNGKLVLALWNYADPGKEAAAKTFHLSIKGKRGGSYTIRVLDPGHGSSFDEWVSMGSPKYPTTEQIKELQQSSVLPPAAKHSIGDAIELKAHALALVEISK
jgi:xylan 1,4-beta-xylosidase